jgi:hypothetical protein
MSPESFYGFMITAFVIVMAAIVFVWRGRRKK